MAGLKADEGGRAGEAFELGAIAGGMLGLRPGERLQSWRTRDCDMVSIGWRIESEKRLCDAFVGGSYSDGQESFRDCAVIASRVGT